MKTAVKVPATNFQSLTIAINDNDEYVISGLDGNGQAFEQVLPVMPPAVIFFDVATRNFVARKIEGELEANYQLVDQVVRAIV